jgi:diguanylate cyclase (GGDEF)-like protein
MKLRLPFLNEKKPARAIKLSYLLSFSIIALISLAIHLVNINIAETQLEAMKVSKRLGKISYYISDVGSKDINKNSISQIEPDIKFGRKYIEHLEFIHKNILAEGRWLETKSDILSFMFYSNDFDLYQRTKDFQSSLEEAVSLLKEQMTNKSEERERINLLINEIINKEIRPEHNQLPQLFNLALLDYIEETNKTLHAKQDAQKYLVLIIVLVLLLEALIIFQPLIKQVDEYHEVLLKQALEDTLTGLSNRRAFMKAARAELASARRNDEPYMIALTDLDHFKSVNDTYGHDVGDEVLKHFSNMLRENLRETDSIGRIGGEEFALVLAAGTQESLGLQVLERLCKKVSETPCVYKDEKGEEQSLNYTVSIGFVIVPPNLQQKEVQDYLKYADNALYEAKLNGRNCVVKGEVR